MRTLYNIILGDRYYVKLYNSIVRCNFDSNYESFSVHEYNDSLTIDEKSYNELLILSSDYIIEILPHVFINMENVADIEYDKNTIAFIDRAKIILPNNNFNLKQQVRNYNLQKLNNIIND